MLIVVWFQSCTFATCVKDVHVGAVLLVADVYTKVVVYCMYVCRGMQAGSMDQGCVDQGCVDKGCVDQGCVNIDSATWYY